MTPEELKKKLINLIAVLDKLPEDARLMQVIVSDVGRSRLSFWEGFATAVDSLGLTVEITPARNPGCCFREAEVDGVVLTGYAHADEEER